MVYLGISSSGSLTRTQWLGVWFILKAALLTFLVPRLEPINSWGLEQLELLGLFLLNVASIQGLSSMVASRYLDFLQGSSQLHGHISRERSVEKGRMEKIMKGTKEGVKGGRIKR